MRSKLDAGVRFPAVSGTFYPNSSSELSALVNDYISRATVKPDDGQLVGLISPHAGYLYSGHVAGHAYRLLQGKSFDTVVLIGLSHRYRVRGAALYAKGAFRTPIGDIEIDQGLAAQLMERNDNIIDLPAAHELEHSLEVQLPFLQESLSRFRIVPILTTDDSPENVALLSRTIMEVIEDKSVLLVGSTDLCHYPPHEYINTVKFEYAYKVVTQSDQVVTEAIAHFDTNYLRHQTSRYMAKESFVPKLECMMCSTGAVYTTMEVAKRLGGNRLEVSKVANSGDVIREQHGRAGSYIVGYMAAAIYR